MCNTILRKFCLVCVSRRVADMTCVALAILFAPTAIEAQERAFRVGEGTITQMALSPSSDIIAVDASNIKANEKLVVLFSIKHEKNIGEIRYSPGGVTFKGMAFSADSKSLVVAGGVQSEVRGMTTLNIWQVPSGTHVRTLKLQGQALALTDRYAVVRAPDNKRMAHLFDLNSEKNVAVLKSNSAEFEQAAASFDGKFIATLDSEGPVRVWETASEKNIHSFNWQKGVVRSLVFPCADQKLAVMTHGTTLYDLKTGKSCGGTGICSAMAISPDLKLIAYHGEVSFLTSTKTRKRLPKGIHIVSLEKKDVIASFNVDPTWNSRQLQFTPNNRHVVAAGDGGIVRVWDVSKLVP